MFLRLFSTSILTCCLLANSAVAAVATYTLSGGTLTGTLNGTAFSGVNFTITADADPADVADSFSPLLQGEPAVSTMTIDGFAPFQITSANFGPFLIDARYLIAPGMAYGGFGFLYNANSGAGFAASGPVPGLSGNVTVSGQLIATRNVTFTTTAGDLIITERDGTATFTGLFYGPVPEPTSMAIYGFGALGLMYRTRRKRNK